MNIQQTVKEEIFPMLGEGRIDEAEKKLRRLMLTLTDKNTTEDHRIVLCSLSRIKYITGDIDNAKYYINRFIDILQHDNEYAETYKDGYCNYINLYTARIYTAKANIAFLRDDIEEIENVLMDIHNYEKSKLIDENKLISAEVLNDLCNLKIEIYKELKEKYPNYVQEDYNYAY